MALDALRRHDPHSMAALSRRARERPLTAPSLVGLGRALDRLLPLWFLAWTLVRLGLLQGFRGLAVAPGLDFRVYRAAGQAVLDGTDPWQASAGIPGAAVVHFAALPIAAQLFAPVALLPVPFALGLWSVVSVGLVVLALRRLHLPLWWLLFPPLVEGLLAGNPQIVLFGLLVLGAPPHRAEGRGSTAARAAAGALAALLKVYAVIPLAARRDWRPLALAAGTVALSVIAAPGLWQGYVTRFGAISSRLVTEAQGGTSAAALLVPSLGINPVLGLAVLAGGLALVAAVALRDVRAAGWLAVPMAWPGAEYHYATFALPIARRLAVLIMAMAVPWSALVGILVLAVSLVVRPRTTDEDGGAPEGLAAWLRWWVAAPARALGLGARPAVSGRPDPG